jgi:hypothetical protein
MAGPFAYRNFTTLLRAPGLLFRDRRMLGMKVINKTGSSIAVNKLVSISGYDTTSKCVKVVLADADAAGLHTDVYVTRAAIANNAVGYVYKGFMSTATLDTNSATTAGDPVFLSGTAGAFTHTELTGVGKTSIIVGYVQVKSSTVGQIAWDIQPVKLYATIDQNA